uniref:Uncharacterized protein n=1 Tax=Romanomermis culicivorax TaxID=13658 RepID=A0A915L6Q6_ROMCU
MRDGHCDHSAGIPTDSNLDTDRDWPMFRKSGRDRDFWTHARITKTILFNILYPPDDPTEFSLCIIESRDDSAAFVVAITDVGPTSCSTLLRISSYILEVDLILSFKAAVSAPLYGDKDPQLVEFVLKLDVLNVDADRDFSCCSNLAKESPASYILCSKSSFLRRMRDLKSFYFRIALIHEVCDVNVNASNIGITSLRRIFCLSDVKNYMIVAKKE